MPCSYLTFGKLELTAMKRIRYMRELNIHLSSTLCCHQTYIPLSLSSFLSFISSSVSLTFSSLSSVLVESNALWRTASFLCQASFFFVVVVVFFFFNGCQSHSTSPHHQQSKKESQVLSYSYKYYYT